MKERVERSIEITLILGYRPEYRSCEATGKRGQCWRCSVVDANGDEVAVWIEEDYLITLEQYKPEG